jgi:hypothetical protein
MRDHYEYFEEKCNAVGVNMGLPAAQRTMENKMIEEIKELFQSFIAPAIEGVRGDIRALDAKIGSLDTKIESYRRELLAEIHRVEQGAYTIEKTLSSDFSRLEQKLDLSLNAMNQKLDLSLGAMTEKIDLFRQEMLAEIRAASKN